MSGDLFHPLKAPLLRIIQIASPVEPRCRMRDQLPLRVLPGIALGIVSGRPIEFSRGLQMTDLLLFLYPLNSLLDGFHGVDLAYPARIDLIHRLADLPVTHRLAPAHRGDHPEYLPTNSRIPQKIDGVDVLPVP